MRFRYLRQKLSVNKRKEQKNVKFYDEVLHKIVTFGKHAWLMEIRRIMWFEQVSPMVKIRQRNVV